ncbi:MAG: hypothetical protein ACR2MX_03785 [Cyclobacteriaceae bacterium]
MKRQSAIIICLLISNWSFSQSGTTNEPNGFGSDHIKGIVQVHYHTTSYNGTMMMTKLQSKIYLLFKDGSVYKNLDYYPPEYLDVKASKLSDPKGWGTWKIDGKNLLLNWGSKTTKRSMWSMIEPKPKGYIIDGYYDLEWGVSTNYGGYTPSNRAITMVSNGIKFNSDGTFETKGYTATLANQERVTATGHKTFKTYTGTYEIDGYTVVLRFADGTVARKTIALANTGDEKDGMLFLGKSYKFKN